MSAGKMSTRTAVLVAISAVFCGAAAADTVIRVDADAPGSNDGTSWENAYNHLQDALAEASSLTGQVVIAVAEGTYRPDDGAGIVAGDRSSSFALMSGVRVSGGYAGYGGTWPDYRDHRVYKTILSGDLGGNDGIVEDPCDLASDASRSENSLHVVRAEGVDQTAILEGVFVSGGNANGSVMEGYGGGLLSADGSARFEYCTLTGNSASGGGGAAYCGGGPSFIQ